MKTDYSKWILGFGLVIAIVVGIKVFSPSMLPLGGSSFESFNEMTITNVTITGNISQPVGANGSRKYVRIENDSALPIFCLPEGIVAAANSSITTTTVGGYGIYINARSTSTQALNFWESRGYTGVVNCAAGGATASATIITSP